MPSCPVRMMLTYPFRMVFVPPAAIAPYMMVVPVAVVGAPSGMTLGPFGMMPPDPLGVIFVPPPLVVPHMTIVPITIVIRMRDHRRNREEGCNCGDGEDSSKLHR